MVHAVIKRSHHRRDRVKVRAHRRNCLVQFSIKMGQAAQKRIWTGGRCLDCTTISDVLLRDLPQSAAKTWWIFLKIHGLETAICTTANCTTNRQGQCCFAHLHDLMYSLGRMCHEKVSGLRTHSSIVPLITQ